MPPKKRKSRQETKDLKNDIDQDGTSMNQSIFQAQSAQDLHLLLQHNAKPEQKNVKGDTLLHITKDIDMIKLLISHNIDVNIKNRVGLTPLQVRCMEVVASYSILHLSVGGLSRISPVPPGPPIPPLPPPVVVTHRNSSSYTSQSNLIDTNQSLIASKASELQLESSIIAPSSSPVPPLPNLSPLNMSGNPFASSSGSSLVSQNASSSLFPPITSKQNSIGSSSFIAPSTGPDLTNSCNISSNPSIQSDFPVSHHHHDTSTIPPLPPPPAFLFHLQCPIISYLLQHKADYNHVDTDGRQVMHTLGCYNVEIMKSLIDANADPITSDEYGMTPIHITSSPHVLEYLVIHAKVDINQVDKYGKTALFYSKNTDYIHRLLSYKADANHSDMYDYTPLYYASTAANMNALISYQADVNHISQYNGFTPLAKHIRSSSTVFSLVRTLLDAKAHTTIHNTHSDPPWFYPSSLSILKLLLGTHIDLFYTTPYTRQNILYTIHSADIAKFVIDRFSIKNTTRPSTSSAIRTCIPLLEFINNRDYEGKTPLHYMSNPEMVKLLIKQKADPYIYDNYGMMPIHYYPDYDHLLSAYIELGITIENMITVEPQCLPSNQPIIDTTISTPPNNVRSLVISPSESHSPFPVNTSPIAPSPFLSSSPFPSSSSLVDPVSSLKNHVSSRPYGQNMYFLTNNPICINILLHYKLDINTSIDSAGYNPLYYIQSSQCVEILLNAKIDPRYISPQSINNTALHVTSSSDVARCLLSYNADISSKNVYGMTPLHSQCMYGHCAIVSFLLSWRGDTYLSIPDDNNMTPYMIAVKYNNKHVISYLEKYYSQYCQDTA